MFLSIFWLLDIFNRQHDFESRCQNFEYRRVPSEARLSDGEGNKRRAVESAGQQQPGHVHHQSKLSNYEWKVVQRHGRRRNNKYEPGRQRGLVTYNDYHGYRRNLGTASGVRVGHRGYTSL